MPHYAGTLSAARQLAEQGVVVEMASDRLLAPAFWSRHVARRNKSPAVSRGPAEIAAWLCEYGARHGKAVLYPTSDDIAWVIAKHADSLRQHFHLFAPPLEAVRALLDKSALYELCVKLAVPAPTTWFPRSEAELTSLCREGRALLLKPRAQMFFSGGKGNRIENVEQAVQTWRLYRAAQYAPGMLEDLPDLDLPLVQEYEPSAAQTTYSISGFIDSSGAVFAARASTKLLQTSRIGVGMCFVASPVDPIAVRAISEVARAVGYFGVFEVEFVKRDGRHLLIDFNPRYYGQMGFDIARGLPLPWIVHHAAQQVPYAQLVAELTPSSPNVYCDRIALAWWLGTALVSGVLSPSEGVRWFRALDELTLQSIDASWRADDPVPTLVRMATVASSPLRNPLSFLRSLRDGSDFRQKPVLPSI